MIIGMIKDARSNVRESKSGVVSLFSPAEIIAGAENVDPSEFILSNFRGRPA